MSATFTSLPVADLEMHARLGIDAALLARAQVVRADDRHARELLGLNGPPGRMDGIVYPYLHPLTGQVVTRRIRRDHPEIENGKPKNKYLSAPGDVRHLFFPPDCAGVLADTAVPIVLVEAEKSCLALSALAARAGRTILPVAMGGCYGWRGRIGKTVDAKGARVDEVGTLPDFDLITWSGRDAVILLDANVSTNEKVQQASIALARELAGREAIVRIGELPQMPGLNGPDDAVPLLGDAALWLVIDRAVRSRVKPRKRATATSSSDSGAAVRLDDFYAYMPMHAYIFTGTREVWPASSVNSRIPSVDGIKANEWIDMHQPVEQMTWCPGLPMLVRDRLVSEGGWIKRPGCTIFNLYRPPQREEGDPGLARPWVDHVHRVYPDDAEHIIKWLAQRVQRPAQKINHALVLGGLQGVGKDTLLEPVKHAIGPWNFSEISPTQLLGRFNGYVKSVILRISEARDLGDVDRYAFYDHLKVYTAAPPDVLRVDEKHLREYSVWNVTGVIITTNYKIGGLYLPADDRRHYVAWTDLGKDDFTSEYWTELYAWYEAGGKDHVATYLNTLDLGDFNPKAPPPRTPAFWDLVDAERVPEDAELADALDRLGSPAVVTLEDLTGPGQTALGDFLKDRKNARLVPHRMETAGYVPVRNPFARSGLWQLKGRRQVVYGRRDLSPSERVAAATALR